MIIFKNVNFSYGQKQVLNDISLEIKKGSFNLFFGQNGSGKSTTIKLIMGLLKAKGITLNYCSMAYMPEKTILPDYITIEEFLSDLSFLNKSYDYQKYLDLFNIDKKQIIYTLSKGNKQKISLIQLLMSDADLYILDEPTNGLDQESINKFTKALKEKRNKTVIIVTHYKNLFSRWKIKRYEFKDGKVYEIS